MTLIASEPAGDDREIPELPLAIGLAGLAPFIALALAIALQHRIVFGLDAAAALIGYGAVALSFLGGSHWGLALRHPGRTVRAALYAAAVVPPLWAWCGLMAGGAQGLGLLAAGLVAHGAVDAVFAGRFAAPRWYARFRLMLAALSAVATAAAGVVLASSP